MRRASPLVMCAALAFLGSAFQADSGRTPPPVPREFRGAWVATVANIDWPSEPGLSVAQQKSELIRIIDLAASLHLNALVFQVRPSCDALYVSQIEPWSEYLTGTAGKPPEPLYDPLALAVQEAHKRGIELHAWFNPYRARHPSAKSPIPAGHVSKRRPEIVRAYGKHLWLDPADPRTREYSLSVIMDVLRRYDIDGIHLDDYFYPYKERDSAGKIIEFPDDTTFRQYRKSGGQLSRDDWRRDAVNQFVRGIYEAKQRIKPWVKFGVSPFGIWKPGNPPQIKGLDAYAELYADSRLWLQKGWVDYLSPQLYWSVSAPAQSYPVLLQWWVEQNVGGRHIWPGNLTTRIANGSSNAWKADEILKQIEITRAQAGAGGNVHFSARVLMRNLDGIADKLRTGPYKDPAVPPASPWLSKRSPAPPNVTRDGREISLKSATVDRPWLWAVQTHRATGWQTTFVCGKQDTYSVPDAESVDAIAVRCLDRYGSESPATVVPF